MEKRNYVSLSDIFEIVGWIKKNKQRLDNQVSILDACGLIFTELKIKCTPIQLRRVIRESKVTWVRPVIVRTGGTEAKTRTRKQITVLTDSILQLFREYGSTPSTELQILKRYLDAENAAAKTTKE